MDNDYKLMVWGDVGNQYLSNSRIPNPRQIGEGSLKSMMAYLRAMRYEYTFMRIERGDRIFGAGGAQDV